MNVLFQGKPVNRGKKGTRGRPGFPFVIVMVPNILPLLPLGARAVEVGPPGLGGADPFSLERPLPFHSFEPLRSTGHFVRTFKSNSPSL